MIRITYLEGTLGNFFCGYSHNNLVFEMISNKRISFDFSSLNQNKNLSKQSANGLSHDFLNHHQRIIIYLYLNLVRKRSVESIMDF